MNRIVVRLALPLETRDPAMLAKVVDALDKDPLFKPGYFGTDERKREPWDAKAIPKAVAKLPDFKQTLFLWRTKAPVYSGSLGFSRFKVNDLAMDFKDGVDKKAAEPLFETIDTYANKYKAEWGFIHPLWRDPSAEAYNDGFAYGTTKFYKLGLVSVFARNWFGPFLTARLTSERLSSIPHCTPSSYDGIRLDLVERPWDASIETLARRKQEVLKVLRPSGLFIEGSPEEADRAPHWQVPPWRAKPGS